MPTDLPYLPTYTSFGREPFHISPPPTKSSLHDLPSIQLPPPLLELRTELVSRSQHLQETRSRIATLPGFPPTSPFALAELADVSLPKHLVSDRFHHITRHYLRRRKGPPIFAPPPCSHCILFKDVWSGTPIKPSTFAFGFSISHTSSVKAHIGLAIKDHSGYLRRAFERTFQANKTTLTPSQ